MTEHWWEEPCGDGSRITFEVELVGVKPLSEKDTFARVEENTRRSISGVREYFD